MYSLNLQIPIVTFLKLRQFATSSTLHWQSCVNKILTQEKRNPCWRCTVAWTLWYVLFFTMRTQSLVVLGIKYSSMPISITPISYRKYVSNMKVSKGGINTLQHKELIQIIRKKKLISYNKVSGGGKKKKQPTKLSKCCNHNHSYRSSGNK